LGSNTSVFCQYFSNYDPNSEYFKYEVKVIDEFIERFNDDAGSYLRKAYEAEKKPYNISRGMLLVSLFDLQNSSFTDKDTTINGFFRQVLDKIGPVRLSFTDPDWYAEAQAVFLYEGRHVTVPLVMRIRGNDRDGAKWMIAGIRPMVPSVEPRASIEVGKHPGMPVPRFIATSGYATGFVELHYVLTAQMQPGLYLEPELINSARGAEFIAQVRSGKLEFQFIKNIRFHFYQVPGWVFTVEQFNRNMHNKGWLISSLQKVTGPEKDRLRNFLLSGE
jgi:hypothetical protein